MVVELYKELDESVIEFLELNNIEERDFYNICRAYSLILLNSEFFREGTVLSANFKHDDVDNFIVTFSDYIKNSKLKQEDSFKLFDVINACFNKTISEDEKSKLPSGVLKDKDNKHGIGYYGTYYSIDNLPDNIVEGIKNKLFN